MLVRRALKYWPLAAVLGVAVFALYIILSPAPEEICSVKYAAAQKETASECLQNLSAEGVAYYTKFLAAFTAILTLAASLQIFFLIKSNDTSREALVQTERAFVYIEDFECEISTLVGQPEYILQDVINRSLHVTRFSARPRWRNSGTTPTIEMVFQVNWKDGLVILPMDFNYPYENGWTSMFLGPSSIQGSDSVEIPAGIIQKIINKGNPLGDAVFVYGRAEYRDLFDGTPLHFVQWCYRMDFSAPDGKTLRVSPIQWGDYNATDSDARI